VVAALPEARWPWRPWRGQGGTPKAAIYGGSPIQNLSKIGIFMGFEIMMAFMMGFKWIYKPTQIGI
jgi:hypothetical protein